MPAERPNVLLLLTDQERYDLTTPGSRPETPAIDELADEGLRFERAYTPISICSSARASLLSGLYPHNHGMLNNCHEDDAILRNLPSDLPTLGERLAEAGYRNTYLGKWHVGRDQGPADFGFEYLGGSDRHHDPQLESSFRDYRRRLGVDPDGIELEDVVYTEHERDPTLLAATTPVPAEATRPYYLAERTIERLEAVAEGDEAGPFFHRSDFLGPHHPYVIPEPYASMYDPAEIDPWPTYAETFAGKPAAHERYLAYRGVAGFDWDDWAGLVAKYMGFMTLIDEQIGRILTALSDLGLADSTVTVHTSDHGDFVGNHRQFNKGPMMYEDTYRVPLFVRWPGVTEPGSVCESFVSLLDLMPTLLDVGGADVLPDLDGRSLRPLLGGDAPDDWPDDAFAEYHGDEFGLYSQRMLRTHRYKLVFNVPDRNELYDLRADPHELTNLVDHPAYRDVRRRLERRLVERMRETDDTIAGWAPKALGL
ncbi:sulfatase-like hydrolase/transferase [Halegenticoccus tardaugens]|uniref:sulfatase-like hydrolase/transferase n=1 Tax=Halegenticoccus tardaugens TaxID=2071624 RepID=UPI00100A9E7B|nr:sulfatase-like hydrolase/transferase [Halegenticoccus tardaugens]